MKYILFLMFSSMESFSIVLLGLILFRNRLKPSLFIKSILIGIILSIISLFLNVIGLNTISPLIQLILMCFLIKFLFMTGYLRSLFITFFAYLLFAVIQALFILITNYYNVIKFSEVQPYSIKGHIVQFVSFIIVILVSVIIRKTNEGYSFIPEEVVNVKQIKYSNKLFIFLISSSLVLLSSIFYEYKTSQLFFYLVLFFVVVSIITIILLYLTLQRDKEQSES
jgi:hypothetical protein